MEQPKIWDYVLGGSAEINNIPNDVIDESLGSPSFKALFPEVTGVPIADGGIPVKRKDINALFRLIGEQIYFIQRGGTYKWDYNATYPIGAIVLHNGEYYRALTENASRDPSVDTNSWKPLVEVKREDLENVQVDDGSLLSKGIVQLTNEISDDETLAVTPKAVKTLLEQLNTLNSKVDTTDNTVSLLTGTVSQNTSDIQNLQAKDAQIDSDIDTLRALIGDGTGVDLSAIQQQIDDIKAVNSQQDADIEELRNSSGGNYDGVIAELQASDTNQNGQIATLESNVSEINSDIDTIETSVTDLNNNVSGIQTNVGTLQGSISSIQSDIEDLKAQSPEGLQSEITRLQKSVDNVEEDLGILVGVKGYDAEYEYDQGDLVLYGDVIYKAKSVTTGNLPTNETYFDVFDRPSVNDYSSDINALNTRVGNTETRITALENAPSGDTSELESRLDTAETNISSLQSTDVTLSDRITALENGSSQGGDTSALESRIETVEGKVTTLENGLNDKADSSTVTALDTRVTALENGSGGSQDLTELTQRVSDAESDIETINSILNDKADKSQLTTINNDISSLTSQVSALDTEVDSKANASDLQTTNENVSALDTRVGTVETSLASKAENSAVTANASSISALDTRVTALENSSSGGGTGGVSYQFYSLDPSGDTDDEVGFDNDGLEPYVTYLADSRNAVTGFSISSNTVTVNIDHTKDIRRMRIIVPAEALSSQTITKTSPFRVLLRYDDSDKSENLYDGFKTNYIHPIAQVFQEGDQDTGSVQGNSAEMSVNKLWWDTDLINTGSPILQVAFTTTVASPIVVLLNF